MQENTKKCKKSKINTKKKKKIGGGVSAPEVGGVCSWGGVCLGGVCSPGGVCSGGLLQGVSTPWVSAPGECLLRGGGIPACTEADTPPRGQTDACKNITFATLLQTVIIVRFTKPTSRIACRRTEPARITHSTSSFLNTFQMFNLRCLDSNFLM